MASRYEGNPRRRQGRGRPQRGRHCTAAGLPPDFSATVRLWATRNAQSWRNRNRPHRQRIEFDQRSAARARRQRRRVIHTAAARAHELLAFRQNFHEFFERGRDAVGAQQGSA